jgi:hypothetical protein
VLAAVLLAGCSPTGSIADDAVVGDQLLPADSSTAPAFSERRLTWAQGGTIHYGQETFPDVVPDDITGLVRVPTGFFLRTGSADELVSQVVYWDGKSVTPVAGRAATFEISVDGRYAGWLDYDTTPPTRGGLAAVRVVDLTTGQLVLSSVDGMGEPGTDAEELAELYANAWPHFVGFDSENRAYWSRPHGDPDEVRVDLETGVSEPAMDSSGGFPREMLWRANRGYETLGDGAAELPEPWRDGGYLTPDGQVYVTSTDAGEVAVRLAGQPRRSVPLRTGHPYAWFAGWEDLGAHRIVLRVADTRSGEAGASGWIVVCDLDAARGVPCSEGVKPKGTGPVVFDAGL